MALLKSTCATVRVLIEVGGVVTVAGGVTLALAFRRASDILFTSVAPSWDEIGQLAAIASIRPLLN